MYDHCFLQVVTLNGAPVGEADVQATNGVMHVMDAVIPISSGTIVTVVTQDEDLNTLFVSLIVAELIATLEGI